MNRREALRLTAALVTGAWLGKLLPTAPEPESAEVVEAADLARWEAAANRRQYPRTWPLLAYDGMLQYSEAHVLLYGYGRPVDVQADLDHWREFVGPGYVLDEATSGDGRAWALITTGLLTDGTRREQRTAWADRERGQRMLELYVRREQHRARLAD